MNGATVALVDQKYKARRRSSSRSTRGVLGLSARALIKRLQDGDPPVHANHARVRDGIVIFGPTCMRPGDAAIVVARVRAELNAR
jgi:hypothetical protein